MEYKGPVDDLIVPYLHSTPYKLLVFNINEFGDGH